MGNIIKIKSGHSTSELDVDSLTNLEINSPLDVDIVGYTSYVLEADSGSVRGVPTIRPLDVSQDYRSIINLERSIWNDSFNSTVLNNNKYKATTTNQTIVLSGGSLNLNADNSITSGDYSMVQTFRYFSLFENAPTYANFRTKFSTTLQNNNVIEFGLGVATGTATPTDGVFFRASGGTLNTVVSYSGFETTQVNVFTPLSGVVYDFLLSIDDNTVEFWVDDVIVSVITQTASTILFTSSTVVLNTATGCTTVSNSLPIFMRNKNTGTVSSPIKASFVTIDSLFADIKLNKDWGLNQTSNGQSSIAAPDGQAAVAAGTQTANMVNLLAPVSVNLDNAAAGYTTLGGQFQFPATGSSETDYIVFAYLNPAGTAAIAGKTLVVNNIYIDSFTSGATVNATTATTLQWSIGVGSTGVSLLTQDSVTGGTRAPRRLGLGIQSFGVGTTSGNTSSSAIRYEPSVPLMVEAGTYLHIILKMPTGVATSGLVIRGLAIINGYFE